MWNVTVVPFVVLFCDKFKMNLGLSDPPVRVAPSRIHGSGVYATRDLKPNELVTAYPVDAVRILMDHAPLPESVEERIFAYIYNDPVFGNGNKAHESWDDYKMNGFGTGFGSDGTPAVVFYGNPAIHSPKMCGHMINDPRGTGCESNCIECPLVGGAITAILITSPVKAGDELLMGYGQPYWKKRG